MTAADDLFPGFAEHRVDTGEAVIFARVGGNGPALLLLHGYPQSHAMWHRVAPTLARTHTLTENNRIIGNLTLRFTTRLTLIGF